MVTLGRRSRRTPGGEAGFTMVEVLVALLIAAIGLLGTVAFQMTMLNANANVNDGAVALRLAAQQMEELQARLVIPGAVGPDQLRPIATGEWTPLLNLTADGQVSASASGAARWRRRFRVRDVGVGQPYNISVEVQYNLDSGNPKVVMIDQERRK